MRKLATLIGIVMLMLLVALPLTAFADTVTVMFGRESNGDNASTHQLEPHNVFISVDDTVTFDMQGPHRVVVYKLGITPDEVTLVNGLVDNAADAGNTIIQQLPPTINTDTALTFTDAGRYLVICNVGTHFSADGMFGWVFVE